LFIYELSLHSPSELRIRFRPFYRQRRLAGDAIWVDRRLPDAGRRNIFKMTEVRERRVEIAMLSRKLTAKMRVERPFLLVGIALAVGVTPAILLAPGKTFAQAQTPALGNHSQILRTLPLTNFYDTPHPLPAGKPAQLIRSEASPRIRTPARGVCRSHSVPLAFGGRGRCGGVRCRSDP
jgi:hypothetical protein